ncbi:MAG: ABC transporter transmembrane domain-containing protein [Chloroflexota bacterium]
MFGRRRGQSAGRPDLPDESTYADYPVDWRKLLAYLAPYKARLALAFVMLLGSVALSLVFPAVIQRVLDSVLEEGNITLLNQITVGLLIVFLVRSITTLLQNYNLNYVGERISMDMRLNLYNHLLEMSLGFFSQRRVGELVSRLSSDVTIMRTALTSNMNTLLQQSLIAIGSIIVMVVINVRLTLFILVLTPVIGVLGALFGVWLRRTSTQVQDELAGATVVVDEVLQGIRIVKSFAREPFETRRYDDAIESAFQAAIRVLRVRSLFGPIVAFLSFGGLALVLWFGGREVLAGRLTGGELIAFLIYGLTVAGAFGSLVNLYTQFQEALGATRRVFQIIDIEPEIMDAEKVKPPGEIEGRITFEDVSFAYEDHHEVLHNINLDIAPGEIIALVGPSGAGKSTVFNLIPRFYDPTDGSVLVDDKNIRDVAKADLREQIAIVPQETLLFGGTVRENIRYGKLDATEGDIIEAAKAANAHDFITELPDGYDTLVGERGVRLSGGQRQRVAIARAILKDARILLLDEATSSLDSESENEVQEALSRLMQGRTTIIIAHRLSTIRVAHRIAVLDRGELIEMGTHDELMAKPDGLYAHLYELQFKQNMPLPAGIN